MTSAIDTFFDALRCLPGERLAETFLQVLFVTLLVFWDFPILLLQALLQRALLGPPERGSEAGAEALPVLLVIPSLLRRRDELTSMQSTVASILEGRYPGRLTVVVSIDGAADAPDLYAELADWVEHRPWSPRASVHLTGTPGRRGKPMAIEQAICHAKALVADGTLSEFPPVYVSTDADADLGAGSLEAIVRRLQRRHPVTGAPPNVVAGGLHVRGDCPWRGWRHFFSEEGQLTLQVAREYLVSNVGRHNLRAMPVTGVPGAFYCTWSEIFLAIPRFMAYERGLRARHWLAWWFGAPPPPFSGSAVAPLPERVAGDTDDTVTAYVATLARWEDGHFTFDPPRSPLHALGHMLRTLLVARPLQYEPEARVYTSSPATVRALFRQRKRWNTARIELSLRLWRALWFHWGVGLPALVVLASMARSLLFGLLAYLLVPLLLLPSHLVAGVLLAYACQALVAGTLTVITLLIVGDTSAWRVLLAVPLVPAYNLAFRWIPAAVGAISDVLLFGNVTGFSPEWTLKRGDSVRIALLFRLRRAALLLVRSVVRGDVPLGWFWVGWRETPWTPSGFEGWTTGKKPRSILSGPGPRP